MLKHRGGQKMSKKLKKCIFSLCFLTTFLILTSTVYSQEWSLTKAARPYKGTKLQILFMHSTTGDAVKQLLPKFEKETGMKVEFTDLPWVQLGDKNLIEGATAAGNFDIMENDAAMQFLQLAKPGYLKELDPYINDPKLADPFYDLDDFFDRMIFNWLDSKYNGKFYGLPVQLIADHLIYRPDIMRKYGVTEVPQTWKEFLEACKKCNHPEDGIYGTVMFGGRMVNTYDWMKYLFSFGGRVFDDELKPIFDNDAGVAATKLYVELFKYAVPESAGAVHEQVISACTEGRVAMAPVFIEGVAAVDYAIWKVGLMPGHKMPDGSINRATNGGCFVLSIPVGCRNPEAAFLLLQYLTSKEVQKEMEKLGAYSPRISTYEGETRDELLKFVPYLDATKANALISVHRPALPHWPKLQDIIGIWLNKAEVGQISVGEALTGAKKEVIGILTRTGYYR